MVSKRKKAKLSISLPGHLEDNVTVTKLRESYKDAKIQPPTGCAIHRDPYRVVSFQDILQPESLAHDLLDSLKEFDFTFKENDLLSLHQTEDLNSCSVPEVSAVRDFIYTDLKRVLENVTGAKYNDTVDLHGIKLEQSNNLLCHSDCLSSRHTAFILYLVPGDWCKEDGGTLDLFESDDNNQPVKVVQSLVPVFNSFSWFEVSNRSWHQVSEVLTATKTRWSISGWFHSDSHPVVPIPPPRDSSLPLSLPGDGDISDTHSWLSLKYLNLEVTSAVMEQFQDESEVSLDGFLNDEKFTQLREGLEACQGWDPVGPANKRNHDLLDTNRAPPIVAEFTSLLRSDGFAVFLSHCTGLALSPAYEDPAEPKYTDTPYGILATSVTRWRVGSYTLLSDQEVAGLPDRLHVFYHVMCREESCDKGVSKGEEGDKGVTQGGEEDSNGHSDSKTEEEEEEDDFGGYISFISDKTSEPLLVVPPQNNTLSLVFTKGDEWCFTKHVGAKFGQGSRFYCFSAQMVGREEEEEEEEEERENSDES
eukprot:sb/3463759/